MLEKKSVKVVALMVILAMVAWAPLALAADNPDAKIPESPFKSAKGNQDLYTDTDNADNAGTANPDRDMNVYLFKSDRKAPIEFFINVPTAPTPGQEVKLYLHTWDVDETSGEVDVIYFNGTRVGALTGNDDQWSTTVLDVDAATVVAGDNLVMIDIDTATNGSWATKIDWAQVVLGQPVGNASIRSAVLDRPSGKYVPGEALTGTVEVDTDLGTQEVIVETNILDQTAISLDGRSRRYSTTLEQDDPFDVTLTIPASAPNGRYVFQVLVYDARTSRLQAQADVEFSVGLFTLETSVDGSGSVYPSGGQYNDGTSLIVQATADAGWAFDHWEGDLTGNTNPEAITMDGNKSVKAVFVPALFSVATEVSGNGSVQVDPMGGTYTAGTQLTVTAVADAGWEFSGWEMGLSGMDNPVSVAVNQNMIIRAVFTQKSYNLVVNVNGDGTVDNAGGFYPSGTEVVLTATANANSLFDSWTGDVNGTGNVVTVVMDDNKIVTANFIALPPPIMYQFTLTQSGEGTVSSVPAAGTDVEINTPVDVTAVPAAGWYFAGFDGSVVSSVSPMTFVLTDPGMTVNAVFLQVMHVLSLNATPAGAGVVSVNGGPEFAEGSTVTVTAAPAVGFVLNKWVVDGVDVAANGSTLDVVMDADKAVEAVFTEVKYTLTVNTVGAGTVTIDPTPPIGGYDLGTVVTLTARDPKQDWTFDNWSGDVPNVGEESMSIQVLMDQNRVVNANFIDNNAPADVNGCVINELTGAGIPDVMVVIAVPAPVKAIAKTMTDANGNYSLRVPTLGRYDLTFANEEFYPEVLYGQKVTEDPTVLSCVAMKPLGVATPRRPKAMSSPRQVYVEWSQNPEYNLKGYNVWRTEVVGEEDPTPVGAAMQLNAALLSYAPPCEFTDDTVEMGKWYVYQIQALSGGDRLSELSLPSDPVKGNFLLVYFPEVKVPTNPDANLYLWEMTPPTGEAKMWYVRIPLSSECSYDVSSTSMQVTATFPANLLWLDNDENIVVQPGGITAGMQFDAYLSTPEGTFKVAGADNNPHPLFGSGVLFDIYVPSRGIEGVGDLILVPESQATPGATRLYDNSFPVTKPIPLELRNGKIYTQDDCIHGDVNNDGVIDRQDAQEILTIWCTGQYGNDCLPWAGDINLDQYIDSADGTQLLRWLIDHADINPSSTPQKNEDPSSLSFAITGSDPTKAAANPLVTIGEVKGAAGDEVTVDIVIDPFGEPLEMSGFTATVNFPVGINGCEFVSAEIGPDFVDGAIGTSVETTEGTFGSLSLAGSSAETLGSIEPTVVCSITFKLGSEVVTDEVLAVELASFFANDAYGHTPRQGAPRQVVFAVEGEGEGEGEVPAEGEGEGEGEEPAEGEGEGEEPAEGEGEEPAEGEGEEPAEGEGEEPAEGEGEPEPCENSGCFGGNTCDE